MSQHLIVKKTISKTNFISRNSCHMSLIKAFLMVAMMAAPAFGADYVVGDDAGWKLNVNYTAWAQGKQFLVGDRLIFKYTEGSHNVHKVSQAADFQECTIPKTATNFTSGNDVITLATPGKKWYVCGVSDHCSKGMKLGINVISDLAPSPTPASTSDPNISAATGYSGYMSWAWVLAALALHQIIIP